MRLDAYSRNMRMSHAVLTMRTEAQANAALHAAAQRIEWEGAHMDTWMQPAPKRQPRRADRHAEDFALLGLLVCTIVAIVAGVL